MTGPALLISKNSILSVRFFRFQAFVYMREVVTGIVVAEKIGIGFQLPAQLPLVVPNVPKTGVEASEGVPINCSQVS
jgi:hypothetical protein